MKKHLIPTISHNLLRQIAIMSVLICNGTDNANAASNGCEWLECDEVTVKKIIYQVNENNGCESTLHSTGSETLVKVGTDYQGWLIGEDYCDMENIEQSAAYMTKLCGYAKSYGATTVTKEQNTGGTMTYINCDVENLHSVTKILVIPAQVSVRNDYEEYYNTNQNNPKMVDYGDSARFRVKVSKEHKNSEESPTLMIKDEEMHVPNTCWVVRRGYDEHFKVVTATFLSVFAALPGDETYTCQEWEKQKYLYPNENIETPYTKKTLIK